MGKSVAPILIGVAVGFAAPYAAGAIGAAMNGVAATSVATASGFANTMATIGATSTFSTAAAMGAGGMMMNAMAETPQAPDYGSMFQQQQGLLADQHSFTRKNTADLEGLLEFGSTHEKNQAFDELEKRGEDATRLADIQTRNDRTAENQSEIDSYIDSSTPPSDEEMQTLIATLSAQELDEFDDELAEERVKAKQVMFRTGKGNSNELRQFDAQLAEIREKGKLAIDKDVQNRVLTYQQGVESIRSAGLNRIMSGVAHERGGFEEQQAFQRLEHNLQSGLRSNRSNQTNSLGLEKFRAEVQGVNNKFAQDSATQRNNAMMSLGTLGMGMNYFGDNKGTAPVPTESIPYTQPSPSTNYMPSMPSFGMSGGGNYFSSTPDYDDFRSGLQGPSKVDNRFF